LPKWGLLKCGDMQPFELSSNYKHRDGWEGFQWEIGKGGFMRVPNIGKLFTRTTRQPIIFSTNWVLDYWVSFRKEWPGLRRMEVIVPGLAL